MALSRRDFVTASLGLGTVGALAAEPAAKDGEDEGFLNTVYRLHPIGVVHNQKGKPVQIEIYDKYVPGLHRLDLCSHVMVLWWFHKNDTPERRAILKVHPRGNKANPFTGVFATHSPVRPNLIAETTCKILAVEGDRVTLAGIDAFDGTPVLDLKSAGTRREPLK